MSYYYSRTVDLDFEQALKRLTEELAGEGFGILTEIDVKATLKKKLGVEFRNYRILGACNPPFAYQALQAERMIGTMLPCNVILQEAGDGVTEIAAIDPVSSMQVVGNPSLAGLARQVRAKLVAALDRVG